MLAVTTGDVLEGSMDRFSTYAILYKDPAQGTPAPAPTGKPDVTPEPTPVPVPQTGDSAQPALWIGLVILGLIGLSAVVFVSVKRKKRE